MKILLLVFAGVVTCAQTIRLEPASIAACRNGLGQASVIWDSRGIAPVILYAGDVAMSGPEAATGTAQTGPWITDGMLFTLRNTAGETLASVRAVLRCAAGAWWPLDVGNEWHFRLNSRAVTGGHAVWRVIRKERIDNVDWSVLEGVPTGLVRLRSDAEGRVYRLADDGREGLLIDPTGLVPGAWVVGARTPTAVTLAGTFADELTWQGPIAGLGRESGRMARGIGPTYYQTDVIAGSSGGFGSSLTLLEAVIGGARFLPNYPRVELILESKMVNFDAKTARNCAIPCYFTACFGADLPTTYKPCVEAAVRGGAGRVALLDPSGATVFESPVNGWVRIPLYREPATLLPAGSYTVAATVDGTVVKLPLEIR